MGPNKKTQLASSSYKHQWDFGGKSLRQFLTIHDLSNEIAVSSDKIQFNSGILAFREHYIKFFIGLSGNVYMKISVGKATSPTEENHLIDANNISIIMGVRKSTSLVAKYYKFRQLKLREIPKLVYRRLCSEEDAAVKAGEAVVWFRVKKSAIKKVFGIPYVLPQTFVKQNFIMALDFTIRIFHQNLYPQKDNLLGKQSPSPKSDDSSLKKSDGTAPRHLATKNLFMSAKFSDFVIRCDDKIFPVHKVILANMSSVFDSMFQQQLINVENECFTITDFDHSVVEQFLQFLYTGQANIAEYAIELFFISEKFAVQDLKELTKQALLKKENE